MKAIVVFGDGGGAHPLNFLLKEGFNHCFVIVESSARWVVIELVNGIMEVTVSSNVSVDIAKFYRDRGYKTVETRQRVQRVSKYNPWNGLLMVANCVGIVKSVLSLNSLALTPYQLYKELTA